MPVCEKIDSSKGLPIIVRGIAHKKKLINF